VLTIGARQGTDTRCNPWGEHDRRQTTCLPGYQHRLRRARYGLADIACHVVIATYFEPSSPQLNGTCDVASNIGQALG